VLGGTGERLGTGAADEGALGGARLRSGGPHGDAMGRDEPGCGTAASGPPGQDAVGGEDLEQYGQQGRGVRRGHTQAPAGPPRVPASGTGDHMEGLCRWSRADRVGRC